MGKTLFALFALLVFGSAAFAASCSSDAYHKSCASCSFDANGKMDRSCSDGYRASGITCTSTSYPIMSAKYAEGKCPEVDSCASELSACVAQYSSGDERADCAEGSVAVCYAASDSCVQSAAIKCGEVENPCKGPALIMLGLLSVVFIAKRE
jgi:hypothetical protein